MSAYKLRCHKCDDADYPGASELCAHLWAEHGDLLELTPEDEDTPWDAISQLRGCDVMSDALLFSAEAEIERLRVCGNCNHCEMDCGCEFGADTAMCESCVYSPSRWKGRKS